MNASDWAKLHGITKTWACRLAVTGRIAGAVRTGWEWDIPEDAPMPDKLISERVAKARLKWEGKRAARAAAEVENEIQGRRAKIVYCLNEGGSIRSGGGKALFFDRWGDAVSVMTDWTDADEAFYRGRLGDSNNQSK